MKTRLTLLSFFLLFPSVAQTRLEGSLKEIIAQRKDALVTIEIYEKSKDLLKRPELVGSGVGFFINEKTILTASHIFKELAKNKDQYLVELRAPHLMTEPFQFLKCHQLDRSHPIDACLLQLKKSQKRSFFKIPSFLSHPPLPGQKIGFINKVTSFKKRDELLSGQIKSIENIDGKLNFGNKAKGALSRVIVSDIPSFPGNSGSPVFDLKSGEIMGMTTNCLGQHKMNNEGVRELISCEALIIPIDELKKFLTQ